MRFVYHRCPTCDFDAVTIADGAIYACPLCLEDSGRKNPMAVRPAVPGDAPEGRDDRASPPPELATDAGDYIQAAEHAREAAAEAHAALPADRLPHWVIYNSPLDQPGLVVARLWAALPEPAPTNALLRASTLAEIRELLPRGLHCLARKPGDDPTILEVWI